MAWRLGRLHGLWVLGTLVLGALLTALAVGQRERSNAAFVQARFETESRELADAIVERFGRIEYGLRSARGVIQVAGEGGMTTQAFRRYMHSRDLQREFPGARGFGFVHRVPATTQRPGVRQIEPHDGERFVIELIEPIENNRAAAGLDIASEPARRLAALSALRSGRATLTAPITLVQSQDTPQHGFLVLLPVYRPQMPTDTPTAREAAGFGWAYAPLVVDDVLAGLPLRVQHIALTLTDITDVERSTGFYSTLALGEAPQAGALAQALLRVPYGRSWSVQVEARPGYAAQFGLLAPRVVGWTGALVTLLLAALHWVWLALRRRQRQAARRHSAEREAHEQRLLELNAGLEQRVQERTRSLADVEHFLRTVLDAVPSMISYWDRHQINRAANRANLAWRLPQGGTLVGRSVREVVGAAVYAEMRPRIEAVLRGEPQSFEVVIHSPADGEPRELRVRYLPDERDGEVKGYYAVLDDVTEVNRSQRDLEAALAVQATEHQRLQSIVEGTHVGTWEWNVQTGECRYNERWAEVLGHDYDELRPDNIRFWVEFIHPDDLVHARDLLARHFSGELAHYECETRMRHADGHWVWVLNRGQVRSWTADGQPEWMYGTELDISKQKAIEHDLREATRAAEAASQSKSAFLANMSHEIRTPLNAVLGVAHLLADSPLDNDQRALLGKAQAAGRSLLGIINDVLDLAKIEAGEMRLADEPFALCGLLREVESVYTVQAGDKGLALTLRVDPAVPPVVRGDMARLRQVLVNLVGNALKFTHTGGVHIAASLNGTPEAPRLRLSVRDSGIGITPEQQARLFQPFTQADETTTRRFGGTGLGLSIVRRLVELMAGQVGLDSAPGQGSDFWLSVPLQRADPASLPAPQAPAADAVPGLNGLRVLLVDDSEINLEIAQRMLERRGARVHTCGDGAQALAWLHQSPGAVDVVLMDVQMPVMDGLEATRRLRADTTFAGLPVIALTAGALANERQRAHDAGFSDFLAKPLDPQELVAALRRACPRPPGTAHATDAAPAPRSPDTLPAGWPHVRGVDAARAHRQLGGDEPLFRRLLARLLAEREDWAALAPDGPRRWASGQAQAWRARAHRLRGSAGMLGALDLARAATALETALDAHASDDAVQALADLRQALAELHAAAADLAEADAPAPVAAAPLDDTRWRARVRALAAQLESNDLAASDGFEALRPEIARRLGPAHAQAMAQAIHSLDFGAARERLRAAMDAAEGETAP
jgi:PAS domain S-box-containing protein